MQIVHEERRALSCSAGRDLELLLGGGSIGVWRATGETSQSICQIACRTLSDLAREARHLPQD